MKEFLHRAINLIWKPMERYPLSIGFLTLLLSLPNLFAPDSLTALLIGMDQDFAILYLLYALCCWVGGKFPRLAALGNVAIHLVVNIVVGLSVGILYVSGTKVYRELLLIVYETSVEEALNFLSFFKWMVLLVAVAFILLCILERFISAKNEAVGERIKALSAKRRRIFALLIALTLLSVPFYGEGSLGNFKHQVGGFVRYLSNAKIVCQTNQGLHNDKCDYTSSNIVLIIGESFNKQHSSLYGYPLNTNPLLSQRENLYVFDDVIAPMNYTIGVFNHLLSMASVGQPCEWFEAPLFPALFRAADYNVLLWANQTGACSYIHASGMDCYNEKNKMMYALDGDLVKDYERSRAAVEKEKNNLIIFHLMGQHFNYVNRFPVERDRFQPSDYQREGLSETELEVIANYDNATLYNDSVVNEIIKLYEAQDAIVLYLSDHGEEVYDFRALAGRSSFDKTKMVQWMRNEVEVPFMIYVTDLYKENHPDIVRRIEASRHRPLMTDDLPHLLLELAGIENQWYDPKRSIINDSFDVNRVRVVNDWCEDAEYVGRE